MKQIIIFVLPILLIGISSCSPFIRTVPKIKESELPESCTGLVRLIKKEWKKNREQDYNQYNKNFLDKLQSEYKDCVLKLSLDEAIQLFGNTPVKLFGAPYGEWGQEPYLFYFLKPGCKGYPQDCELLVFRIKNGSVKEVYVQKHEFIEEKK